MPKNKEGKVYLGIDPGTHRIGYGAVQMNGNKFILLKKGLIEKKKKGYSTDQLPVIYKQISELIKKIKPDEMAVEKLFFSKNQTTAMTVSEARGVILLAGAQQSLKIREFSPNTIKQAVTGYGSADKKAILKMVSILLGLKDFKPIDDTSDALAIAITAGLIKD
ncbi:MAG: crossover junction endodeoxyribonuclease RuvC [Candidatus Colwellbacteria bacterium]|jgi:crossover junction endodeoxyribonuclease RuvC|nr:crossover junction endodeoxyribonuclease RuvC [Candidatus Colwellbacteria bacterium]MCK9497312.1 crossover junction endodeoxyribonuclease RuvC [Candidatus Colwellbacteria bacterium]MDD3752345.1 crossover junction endodeoxyribonuclease RuvC [Candidatus Colwellbacteria bacterium]MDD4818588.1 crossover junction endodeoxyribonuclease RuvC [Candidatus Colwellbacteria bacterium]